MRVHLYEPSLDLIERIRGMAKNYPLRMFLMAGPSMIALRWCLALEKVPAP